MKGKERGGPGQETGSAVHRSVFVDVSCKQVCFVHFMMKCDKRIYWRKCAVFCCCFIMFVCEVKTEELQCTKKQVLYGRELPGLFTRPNVCQIESEGQNLTESDCVVWDFGEEDGNYHDCSDLQFSSAQGEVSGVEFYPYFKPYPNLNISFRNIDWHYMQYRLQVSDQGKICHKLQFNNSVTPLETLRLSFACRTFGWWAADVSAEMMMNVGSSSSDISRYAHFVMKIPPSEKNIDSSNKSLPIKDWYVLVIVDVSQNPYLLVYWPTVPDHYNVTEYKVQIEKDEPEVVKLSSCRDGYCSHKMHAGYSSRNVSVSVQPVHEDCRRSCYSYSPPINVVFFLPVYIIVLLVLVPILIVIIIICSTYYFCCASPVVPPKVLLLHDATTERHSRVVRILAEYLKNVGGVRCLMAEVEVPRTESQNGSKWLHRTMDEVDAVLYVASPPSHMDIRYSEYPNVVFEALSLIQRRRSCSDGKCPYHERASRYLVAVPSYCSKENIPNSLLDVPRFSIPNELSWLLWTLYNQQCWVPPFTWMAKAYLNYCWCPGPMSAYRRHGSRLKGAIKTASARLMLDEELPVTPQSSRRTKFTQINKGDELSENLSLPYTQFPGPINELPLLAQRDGSVISEEEIASREPQVPNVHELVL